MKVIEFVIKQHPIWVTFGYLGLLAGVFYKHTSSGASLTLNELGDFLAGAFAPLAFYWLVLGFFQQGQELRNSVEALNLQAKELKNSVEAQNNLAKNAAESLKNQLESEKSRRVAAAIKSTPRFVILEFSEIKDASGEIYLLFVMINSSASAHSVSASSHSKMYPEILSSNYGRIRPGRAVTQIETQEKFEVYVFRPTAGGPLIIRGKNIHGIDFEQEFTLQSADGSAFDPKESAFRY